MMPAAFGVAIKCRHAKMKVELFGSMGSFGRLEAGDHGGIGFDRSEFAERNFVGKSTTSLLGHRSAKKHTDTKSRKDQKYTGADDERCEGYRERRTN